ncbi:MAG: Asp-tRNA(Asn)/Glu-tRNA(Gln) amidotransferase subunit GatC [Betaproteobacteria bacterium]
MSISENDVRRIANLARLDVTESEVQDVLVQLQNIFSLIEQLQSVDTCGVEPMSHGQDVGLRLREDRVTETDQRSLLQSIAPQVEAGLYLVPKVLE